MQDRAINKSSQLRADFNLFDQACKPGDLEVFRSLYANFCKDDFALDLKSITPEISDGILDIIRRFSQLGVLHHNGALGSSMPPDLHSDYFIRFWLIAESYIENGPEDAISVGTAGQIS